MDIAVVFEDVLPEAIPARIARERFKMTTPIYRNNEVQNDGP